MCVLYEFIADVSIYAFQIGQDLQAAGVVQVEVMEVELDKVEAVV